MILFLITAALMSTAAAAAVLRGAAVGERATGAENAAQGLHRRELAEVDDLSERGLLAEEDRVALRAEAARRLLAAAEGPALAVTGSKGDRRTVLAIAACAPLLAIVAYILVGAPGFPDQPFTQRVAQWRAADPRGLQPSQMAAVLEEIARERPGDYQPLQALGIAQMASGEAASAQTALRRAIRLAPERADLWTSLGEAFASEADGVVGDDAQAAFRQALQRDPKNIAARYYLGRAAFASGDKAAAAAGWSALLTELPQDDPRRAVLQAEIAQALGTAPPPGAGGPSAAQVAAAQGQVGAEQIRAMVDGLAAKLAAAPGDPDGWVRLVRAYGVLGDTAKRDAALNTARARFATRKEVLQALDAAATGGGQ